ncbi:MAG: S-methyl-5'-thioadenosine phosphorylase [Methanosarcinales archaeon]|nr:MAG: S-methyl-5'-thioadenosine phosphorylase [Methanosarcinales archaeon]
MHADVAIIGGSGVYDASMLDVVKEVEIDTTFGKPSDNIIVGNFGEIDVAFLPRHGRGHFISPGNLNSRANILALKKLGVQRIIAASAVGSLKLEKRPLDIVIPDQIFDRTNRKNTFFEEGVVVHTGFADPFCSNLSALIEKTGEDMGYRVHRGGTYLCMEGPQFSTRAESRIYQSLDFDIIGMTALPEAKLAREAEICYAMIATVTDYDVWHETDVDIEMVLKNIAKNEASVRTIIKKTLENINIKEDCTCRHSLSGAIITDPAIIPISVKEKLKDLIGKYIR